MSGRIRALHAQYIVTQLDSWVGMNGCSAILRSDQYNDASNCWRLAPPHVISLTGQFTLIELCEISIGRFRCGYMYARTHAHRARDADS